MPTRTIKLTKELFQRHLRLSHSPLPRSLFTSLPHPNQHPQAHLLPLRKRILNLPLVEVHLLLLPRSLRKRRRNLPLLSHQLEDLPRQVKSPSLLLHLELLPSPQQRLPRSPKRKRKIHSRNAYLTCQMKRYSSSAWRTMAFNHPKKLLSQHPQAHPPLRKRILNLPLVAAHLPLRRRILNLPQVVAHLPLRRMTPSLPLVEAHLLRSLKRKRRVVAHLLPLLRSLRKRRKVEVLPLLPNRSHLLEDLRPQVTSPSLPLHPVLLPSRTQRNLLPQRAAVTLVWHT